MGKTTVEQNDQEKVLLENALRWVKVEMIEGGMDSCPFCTWTPQAGATEDAMDKHFLSKHPFTITVAYQQKSLQPELRSDDELQVIEEERDFMKKAGLEQVEDLDRVDLLFVPDRLKREIAQRGGVRRWVRGDRRLQQCLARGAKLVERGEDDLPFQASTEDTTVRANEMFLIEWPAERAALLRRQKEQRTQEGLEARAEDLKHLQTSIEKKVYDSMLSMNYDKERAAQVARAVASGQGNWKAGSEAAHTGITVADRHGAREF